MEEGGSGAFPPCLSFTLLLSRGLRFLNEFSKKAKGKWMREDPEPSGAIS